MLFCETNSSHQIARMPNTENPILQVDWKGDEAGPFKTALELGGNVVDFEELEAFENSSTFIIPPVEIKGKVLSGPLYNPGDLEGFFLPHLSDTLSGVLTAVGINDSVISRIYLLLTHN